MFEHTLNRIWMLLDGLNYERTGFLSLNATRTWLEQCTNWIFENECTSNRTGCIQSSFKYPKFWMSAMRLNWTGRDFERTNPGMISGAPMPNSQYTINKVFHHFQPNIPSYKWVRINDKCLRLLVYSKGFPPSCGLFWTSFVTLPTQPD